MEGFSMVGINISKVDSVTMVEISGRVDSTNANELGDALGQQLELGAAHLVLDLSAVDYMSSAGLRELVTAFKKARKISGDVRLVQPSPRVLEILEMSGLDTVFEIFPDRSGAVSSF
ncbi:STAS domain-containing protein [Anaerolineae bacterium CFX9]|jgi:anti-anti-sigma factor|nr:STAS domain-containing protein [Anaerolineae bacterium CFX9]